MMAPMSISEEFETRAKSVLIEIVQAHPEMSIDQIVTELGLDEEDAARLRSTPLSQLVRMVDDPEPVQAAPDPAPGATGGVNGTARSRPKAKAKRKTPPRAPRSKTTGATEAVTKYVAKIRKGTKFSTSEIMKATGIGRKTVLRVVDTLDNVKKSGLGRSAFLLKK
jgi:hypothetical protein